MYGRTGAPAIDMRAKTRAGCAKWNGNADWLTAFQNDLASRQFKHGTSRADRRTRRRRLLCDRQAYRSDRLKRESAPSLHHVFCKHTGGLFGVVDGGQ